MDWKKIREIIFVLAALGGWSATGLGQMSMNEAETSYQQSHTALQETVSTFMALVADKQEEVLALKLKLLECASKVIE